MSTVEITRVEDVREGDLVTITRNETTIVARLHGVEHGDYTHLDIATLPCTLIVGDGAWTFRGATREAPDLPTEEGSVIVKATIRGVEGRTAILDDDGYWVTTTLVGGYRFHEPKVITAWEPGRIVPEGGAA